MNTPTPPTTFDEWEEGAVWQDEDGDMWKRDGDYLYRRSIFGGDWFLSGYYPESVIVEYGPLTTPDREVP